MTVILAGLNQVSQNKDLAFLETRDLNQVRGIPTGFEIKKPAMLWSVHEGRNGWSPRGDEMTPSR